MGEERDCGTELRESLKVAETFHTCQHLFLMAALSLYILYK